MSHAPRTSPTSHVAGAHGMGKMCTPCRQRPQDWEQGPAIGMKENQKKGQGHQRAKRGGGSAMVQPVLLPRQRDAVTRQPGIAETAYGPKGVIALTPWAPKMGAQKTMLTTTGAQKLRAGAVPVTRRGEATPSNVAPRVHEETLLTGAKGRVTARTAKDERTAVHAPGARQVQLTPPITQ